MPRTRRYSNYTIIPNVELSLFVLSTHPQAIACLQRLPSLNVSVEASSRSALSSAFRLRPQCFRLSFSSIHPLHACFPTHIHSLNMRAATFSFKTSALLIALVLVPIVILFCCVAVALACSEFWSTRSLRSCFPRFRRNKNQGRKRSQSDPASPSSNETPGISAAPSENGDTVAAREQV